MWRLILKNYAQSPSKMHRQVQLRRALDAPDYRSDSVGSPLNPTVKSHRDNPEVRARLAALQMRRRGQAEVGAQTSDEVHALAGDGISGSGGTLPHQDAIQASFGHHDISGVQAHMGPQAAQATEALGARGYAAGSHVAFLGQPTLHTAAHEAAHVVQQRAGVHLKGGIGAEGDVYERHADAVAERVVAGKSATDLLDGIQSGVSGAGLQFSLEEEKEGEEEEAPGSQDSSSAMQAVEEDEEGNQKKGEGTEQVQFTMDPKAAAADLARGAGPKKEDRGKRGPEPAPKAFREMKEGTGPVQAEEVHPPMQKSLTELARKEARSGKDWNHVLVGGARSILSKFKDRDVKTFMQECIYPSWLEGLKDWMKVNLAGRARAVAKDGKSWSEIWPKLEAVMPKGGFSGGWDIEPLAKALWEKQHPDAKSEGDGKAAPMGGEFKADDVRTWKISRFEDRFKVAGSLGAARSLVQDLERGMVGEDGKRGPKAEARVGKPFLAKLGAQAVAFTYRHDGDRKVTPVMYDFARSPNKRDPKKWDWEYAGTWAGAPALP